MAVLKHPKGYSGLLALPEEIVHAILAELDYASLSACRLVCRSINCLYKLSAELRFKFELGLDGLVSAQCCNMSFRDRLDLILKHRKAWRKPQWRRTCEVQIPGEFRVSEIIDHVFAGLAYDGLRFDAYSLPIHASSRRWHDLHWAFDIQSHAYSFATDPSQDLVIFMIKWTEWRGGLHNAALDIRSLNTASPHPRARTPQRPFHIPFASDGVSTTHEDAVMQITGDLLAVIITMQEDYWRVMLWNWPNGKLLLDRTTAWQEEIQVLSPTAFIITSVANQGSISVYSMCPCGDSLISTSEHVATLELPPIKPDARLAWFSGHMGLYPNSSLSPKPFLPSSDSAIISMVIEYENDTAGIELVTELHVPNTVFLSYILEYDWTEPQLCVASWNEWGPMDTRMFVAPIEPLFESHNYGQRVILSPEVVPSRPGYTLVEILDFNPNAARGSADEVLGDAAKCGVRVENGPRVINESNIFLESVVTLLPYTSTRSYLEGSYSGVILDDERLIGLKGFVSEDSTNHISVFVP